MLDYVRWIFNIEFCTPRYVIMRRLAMDKLRIGYNGRYKKFDTKNRCPSYLRKENLYRWRIGLVRLRCGNMEEGNKYRLEEEYRSCVFCGIGADCMEHYVEEYHKVRSLFKELGKDREEI
ncbi:hypothetical protein ALC57_11722 [Trachymyrmex cornetzi]|uniref:Uncharacterized protein n=1 Tax=Trachymyrmex cornetzi TaxID=471704 RepID=A0A151J265_9HYME|nr:hypothetical protein ALC57_11722 [Trachymyrmex cornetzi]